MSEEEKAAQIKTLRTGLQNHTPTEDGVKRIGRIRSAASLLGEVIIDNTERSRDQSLALTHLEDTVMRAERAVALEGPETDAK